MCHFHLFLHIYDWSLVDIWFENCGTDSICLYLVLIQYNGEWTNKAWWYNNPGFVVMMPGPWNHTWTQVQFINAVREMVLNEMKMQKLNSCFFIPDYFPFWRTISFAFLILSFIFFSLFWLNNWFRSKINYAKLCWVFPLINSLFWYNFNL